MCPHLCVRSGAMYVYTNIYIFTFVHIFIHMFTTMCQLECYQTCIHTYVRTCIHTYLMTDRLTTTPRPYAALRPHGHSVPPAATMTMQISSQKCSTTTCVSTRLSAVSPCPSWPRRPSHMYTQPTAVNNTTVCSIPITTCTAGDLPNNPFVSRVCRCQIRTPPSFCIHCSPNSIFCFRCLSILAVAAAAADARCGRAGIMLLCPRCKAYRLPQYPAACLRPGETDST